MELQKIIDEVKSGKLSSDQIVKLIEVLCDVYGAAGVRQIAETKMV